MIFQLFHVVSLLGFTRDLPEEQQEKDEQTGRQLGRSGTGDRVGAWWHLLQDPPIGCRVILKYRTSALKCKADMLLLPERVL